MNAGIRTGVPAFTAGVVSIKLISLVILGRYSRGREERRY